MPRIIVLATRKFMTIVSHLVVLTISFFFLKRLLIAEDQTKLGLLLSVLCNGSWVDKLLEVYRDLMLILELIPWLQPEWIPLNHWAPVDVSIQIQAASQTDEIF